MNDLTSSSQNAQEIFLNAADSFFSTFAGYLPSVIGALIVFILGLIVSSALKGTTKRILDWTGFSHATEKTELSAFLKKIGVEKPLSAVIASLAYWIVFLIFLTAVFEILGLQIVVATLSSLIAYLPNVIVAVITIILALLLGRFVKGLIVTGLENLNASLGVTAAGIAEIAIILFGAIIAASQLGLDVDIITANITLVIAGVIAILVLSIGLGSRTTSANLINGYYAKQIFKEGAIVNLGGYKGKVKEVNNVAIILESDNGEIIIPNEAALKYGSIVKK
jgi:hypothetical protein